MDATKLIDAKERIKDPKNWTQKAMARNIKGKWCSSNHPEATCWCATGSLKNSYYTPPSTNNNNNNSKEFNPYFITEGILNSAAREIYNKLNISTNNYHWTRGHILYINDYTDHLSTLDAFCLAIDKFETFLTPFFKDTNIPIQYTH